MAPSWPASSFTCSSSPQAVTKSSTANEPAIFLICKLNKLMSLYSYNSCRYFGSSQALETVYGHNNVSKYLELVS